MTRILGPLAVALRADMDVPTFTLYARALADVPPALLEAGAARALQTRRWFPTVAELRADCEAARLAASRAQAWRPCEVCRDRQPGWMAVIDPVGTTRLDRCACWTQHQARLARTGVVTVPVALLEAGPREWGDDEVRGE